MGAPGHRDPHAQRQRLRVVKPLYASADAAVECGHTPAAALLDVLAVVTVGCKVGTVACVQCCAGHDFILLMVFNRNQNHGSSRKLWDPTS